MIGNRQFMDTKQAQKEMLEFQAFLGRRIAEGTGNLPPEEVLKEYRTHQLEAGRLKDREASEF